MNERQTALLKGDLAACRRLIVAGSTASLEIGGVPPLGWAVESGSTAVVRYLLRLKGTSVDARDLAGRSPLHRLLRSDQIELNELGRTEIVKMLLAKGADPRLQDSNGESPMLLAERYFPELLDILRSAPGEQKALPPVRRVPRAKAWPGKKSERVYSSRDMAMWSTAACLFAIITTAVTHPAWFRRAPAASSVMAASSRWESEFAMAREGMDRGDFASASSYARSALKSNPKEQSKKAAVYELAARASLRNRDLADAEWVFANYSALERHDRDLDESMAKFRLDYQQIGEERQNDYLAQARQSLQQGDFMAARSHLEAAKGVSRRVGVPYRGGASEAELKAREDEIAARVEARREWQRTWRLAKNPNFQGSPRFSRRHSTIEGTLSVKVPVPSLTISIPTLPAGAYPTGSVRPLNPLRPALPAQLVLRNARVRATPQVFAIPPRQIPAHPMHRSPSWTSGSIPSTSPPGYDRPLPRT